MILKLLRTELRSESLLILLASIVSVLMWLSETAARNGDQSATLATLIFGQFPFPILIGVIAVRKQIQKRGRLLAQLPVTGIAIRISSWLSYFVVIGIACVISAVILALYPITPRPGGFASALPNTGWANVAAVGALMVAAFITVAALVRTFHLGLSVRRTAQYFVFPAWVIVILLLRKLWLSFFDPAGPFRIGGILQWDMLLPMALGSAFALIVADILLDRLVDNRLG